MLSSFNSDHDVSTDFDLYGFLIVEALVDLQVLKDSRIPTSGEHVVYCIQFASELEYPKLAL